VDRFRLPVELGRSAATASGWLDDYFALGAARISTLRKKGEGASVNLADKIVMRD
jgi:hypothetical protein